MLDTNKVNTRTSVGADAGLRLQKLIAEAGLCSRRKAEEWVREGRVTVNGSPAKLANA